MEKWPFNALVCTLWKEQTHVSTCWCGEATGAPGGGDTKGALYIKLSPQYPPTPFLESNIVSFFTSALLNHYSRIMHFSTFCTAILLALPAIASTESLELTDPHRLSAMSGKALVARQDGFGEKKPKGPYCGSSNSGNVAQCKADFAKLNALKAKGCNVDRT